MSKKLVDYLNLHLSDLHVLYTKLHNYHWNVEGHSFFQLHETLEGLYDGVAEELDSVAERILQLGERPLAKLSDFIQCAKIQEVESKGIQAEELLAVLLKDYQYLVDSLKSGIEIAGEANDPVTEGLLTDLLTGYEKSLWMLKAVLA